MVLQTIFKSEYLDEINSARGRLEAAGIGVTLSSEEQTRELIDCLWGENWVRRETVAYRVYLLQVSETQAEAACELLAAER